MSIRKTMALAGTLLVFVAGLAVAQEQTQDKNKVQTEAQVKAQTQNQTQVKAQHRARTRAKAGTLTAFVDENGDGINDAFRDADGDGIPNCQDPDWAPPQDGTGYQVKAGQAKQFKGANGKRGGQALSNASFRTSVAGTCCTGGICDGTGPKGRAVRKGRG